MLLYFSDADDADDADFNLYLSFILCHAELVSASVRCRSRNKFGMTIRMFGMTVSNSTHQLTTGKFP